MIDRFNGKRRLALTEQDSTVIQSVFSVLWQKASNFDFESNQAYFDEYRRCQNSGRYKISDRSLCKILCSNSTSNQLI